MKQLLMSLKGKISEEKGSKGHLDAYRSRTGFRRNGETETKRKEEKERNGRRVERERERVKQRLRLKKKNDFGLW